MTKFLSVVALLFITTSVQAADISDEKKRVVDEMLEITGSIELGKQMGTAVANSMLNALAKADDKLTPKIIDILKVEIAQFLETELISKRFLNEMSYQIYDKYYSIDELEEIVAFFKSETGKKVARLSPIIAQEAMEASQQHVISLKPQLENRIRAALEREGQL